MNKAKAVFKKGDLLLFLFVLAVGILMLVFTLLPKDMGSCVTVKSNGETVGQYRLSDTLELTVTSSSGGQNVLVIEDGAAYIKHADCPDRLCMHQGRISESGDTLICLPNRMSVTVN